MTEIGYTEQVMDHFMKPRNVGTLEDPDGYGKVGNPVCGDLMEMFINVDDQDRISDIRFRTFGCCSAIATTSMATEMTKSMTLDEALAITRDDVAGELGGLPPKKMHCSNLAADALTAAIEDYRAKRNGREPGADETEVTACCSQVQRCEAIVEDFKQKQDA